MYGVVSGSFVIENFQCFINIDEDQWMHDSIIFEEADMNKENEDELGMNEEHVDCFDTFNTSQVLIWFLVIKVSK